MRYLQSWATLSQICCMAMAKRPELSLGIVNLHYLHYLHLHWESRDRWSSVPWAQPPGHPYSEPRPSSIISTFFFSSIQTGTDSNQSTLGSKGLSWNILELPSIWSNCSVLLVPPNDAIAVDNVNWTPQCMHPCREYLECLTDPINSNEPALESAASIATYWHILKHVETLTNLIQCSKLANHVWWRPGISCHIHVLTPGAALASFLLAPVLILLPSCLLAIQHVFSLFLSSPCELG